MAPCSPAGAPPGAPVWLPARGPLHFPDHGERGDRHPADGELPAAPAPVVAVPNGRLRAGAMDGHHGLAAAGHGQPQDPLTSRCFGWHVRIFWARVLDRRPRRAGRATPRRGPRGVPGGQACQKPCLFMQRSPPPDMVKWRGQTSARVGGRNELGGMHGAPSCNTVAHQTFYKPGNPSFSDGRGYRAGDRGGRIGSCGHR